MHDMIGCRMTAAAKNAKLIRGATGEWEVVIGLEVHAQVTSQSKLFSRASTAFGGEPNSHVSLVDAAMPGMLPVINAECVRQAVRTGLALKAKINRKSIFERKNYFYPDLPQGYQISQYKSPIVGEGEVTVTLADGETITVGIERLHLEQDAGKSLHDQRHNMSLVDLNRSGAALMEIVSKPHLHSAEEAKAYLEQLRQLLRDIGACDGDMEKGHLRADVNVSVHHPGEPLGTRCEIKNLNSIRFAGQAIDYEARRQIAILEGGGRIDQETRRFDPDSGETTTLREKEEAHDYRYFPDPDLLPLELTPVFIAELEASLPESSEARKERFVSKYRLSFEEANVLTAVKDRADYYEEMVKDGAEPKAAANWLLNEYLGRLSTATPAGATGPVRPSFVPGGALPSEDHRKFGPQVPSKPESYMGLTAPSDAHSVDQPSGPTGPSGPSMTFSAMGPTGPSSNSAIVQMITDGTISGKTAKEVLDYVMVHPQTNPRAFVAERGLTQVSNLEEIARMVDEVIAANPDKVAQAKSKPPLVGWLVGQVMKASGGKANPNKVSELLKRKLGL
jgi:aspartyl-tRNA(Asn)/glutamyl-tRNA(Gln) amidotransferase subunit B